VRQLEQPGEAEGEILSLILIGAQIANVEDRNAPASLHGRLQFLATAFGVQLVLRGARVQPLELVCHLFFKFHRLRRAAVEEHIFIGLAALCASDIGKDEFAAAADDRDAVVRLQVPHQHRPALRLYPASGGDLRGRA
jgi:hypothetical protein